MEIILTQSDSPNSSLPRLTHCIHNVVEKVWNPSLMLIHFILRASFNVSIANLFILSWWLHNISLFYFFLYYLLLNTTNLFQVKTVNFTLKPSIRDRVQCKKDLALKKTVFSTFSNFFKKVWKKIIKAILCNFSMRLLKYF